MITQSLTELEGEDTMNPADKFEVFKIEQLAKNNHPYDQKLQATYKKEILGDAQKIG